MPFFGSSWDDDTEEEGSMFGPKRGTWWISSKTDSRWDESGSAYVGGFVRPSEVDEAIERLKKKYGNPPEDLEWGYMKD